MMSKNHCQEAPQKNQTTFDVGRRRNGIEDLVETRLIICEGQVFIDCGEKMIDFFAIYFFCSMLLKLCEEKYLLYLTNTLFKNPLVQRTNFGIIDLEIKVFSSVC